jgi:hypothetical protein
MKTNADNPRITPLTHAHDPAAAGKTTLADEPGEMTSAKSKQAGVCGCCGKHKSSCECACCGKPGATCQC